MLSIVYPTNRGLFPMRNNPLGQYDLLASCLEVQSFQDWELIVVDRQNTLPRPEIEYAVRRSTGGVQFLRPRATPWTRLGAFAPNAARNTALAYARGETIVGIDDCYEFSAHYLERIADLAADHIYTASVLRQIDNSVAYPPQFIGSIPSTSPIGGICSYPLAVAVAINGWDERFDGTSGGDVDFTARLRAYRGGVQFVRDAQVAVLGHYHGERTAIHPRCQRLSTELASQRIAHGDLLANQPWSAIELDAFEHCGRREGECVFTGFACEYNQPEGMRERAIRLEYESQSWFNLAEARMANGFQ